MTISPAIAPYPFFTEASGVALTGGMIYIGAANLDPRTNPITVYQDKANTITWAQPLRTVSGYPSYQGAPSNFYPSAENYSIIVTNKNGAVVFRSLSTSGVVLSADLASSAAGEGDDLVGQSNGKTARENSPVYIWRQRPSLWGGDVAGTPAENAARLQAQVDALAADGGGTLRLVEDVIQIDRPIYVPEKISIIGPGQGRCLLQNTYVYNFRQSSIFMPGNFHPAFTGTGPGSTGGLFGNVNSKALAAVTSGSYGVTLSAAPGASDFIAGDMVIVFDPTTYYVSSDNKVSYLMELRRVTSVSGSTVYLDESIREDLAAGMIYNMRTGTLPGANILAAGTDTPRKLFNWGDGQIAGFSVDTVGYWVSDSAVYKGEFSDIEVERARSINYGNTYQFTRFNRVNGKFMILSSELSLNSENTVVENFTMAYDPVAASAAGVTFSTGISMQENGMDVTYRDGSLTTTGATSGSTVNIINFLRASVLDVNLRNASASNTGAVLNIDNITTGGKREATDGRFRLRWEGPCGFYVSLQNANSAGHVIDGDFRGTPANGAFRINQATQRNVIARTASFLNGTGQLGAGTSNQEIVGCYVGGGMLPLTGTNYATLQSNNVRDVRTSRSIARRGGATALAVSNALTGTTTKTTILSAPIGTSTLQRQDVIEFSIRVNVTGSAGTKTITFDVVDNTTPATFIPVSFALPVTAGVYEFSGRIDLQSPASIYPQGSGVGAGAVTTTRTAITTDLSAKDITLAITGTLANSADTINFQAAVINLNNPVQI